MIPAVIDEAVLAALGHVSVAEGLILEAPLQRYGVPTIFVEEFKRVVR